MIPAISARFIKLCARLGILDQGALEIWNRIREKYSEPHRFYHTLTHIDSMLNHLDRIKPDGVELALAVWFHDVIYDPRSSILGQRATKR